MEAYWIWFAAKKDVSSRLKLRLLEKFPDPEAIFFAEEAGLSRIEGMTASAISDLLDRDLTAAKQVVEECRRQNMGILTYGMPEYPVQLRNIDDPPMVLYYKGKLPDFEGLPVVAVVGTRKSTPYGLKMARKMGYQIASCGATVVSGMALGEDAAAMEGALMAGSGVIAVLGCGLDIVYPPSNRKLYEDMVTFGCVLSEYEPGTPPLKWNFPRRNRIISGLSCGVLVVEAPERSGALITARFAGEQGRDVFVVPGNIDVAACIGSNRLLREGAMAVSSGWDVVSEYEHRYPGKLCRNEQALSKELPAVSDPQPVHSHVAQKRNRPEVSSKTHEKSDKKAIDNPVFLPYSDENIKRYSSEEQAIIDVLGGEKRSIDDVIAQSGLPSAKALSVMTLLELKGVLCRDSGKQVSLKRSK